MKLALIICTYKRPESIYKLMKSVQCQKHYPDEITIIDASTDNKTKQLFSNHDYKNLKYIKVSPENRGLTKQRNIGVNATSRQIDIISFLDDDIILDPYYFKNLLDTYKEKPEAIAVGGYITNDNIWFKGTNRKNKYFCYDKFNKKDSKRFRIRNFLGLAPNRPPCFLPKFSHGRSVGHLPPSNKTYEVEQFMGGVSSYKASIFKKMQFSTYFEGYGLYEDADFCFRLLKLGKVYVNTSAKCEHHHHPSGRPNRFKYGKMVVKNGWYIWRLRWPNPGFKNVIKWHLITLLLASLRFLNIFTRVNKRQALSESTGRFVAWFILIFKKPKIKDEMLSSNVLQNQNLINQSMGYVITSNKDAMDKPMSFKHNSQLVYKQSNDDLHKIEGFFLEGYLRFGQKEVKKEKLSELNHNWPLPDDYSGSFAFTLITDKEIIIANDCIGVYPLFYHFDKGEFSVSNRLLDFQNLLKLDIDKVAKAERLFAPENSEIGSRTLLKGVKRLLPGERIVYDFKSKTIQKSYDNRLYTNIHNTVSKKEIDKYWQLLSNEIRFTESLNLTSTDIAISGGLDSRVLIGAMTPKADSIAYHYGKPTHYETKVAKKIAQLCGFQFKAHMDYVNQFPQIEKLRETIKKVGPPYAMSWYNIFEITGTKKTNLILGDMCEALHGRNIKAFTTRQSRIKNFIKHYVLNKPYMFTPSTEKAFKEWKSAKIKNHWDYINNESLLTQTKINLKPYKNEINKDLNEIFDRIERHQLPYVELYDELFSWYTHARIPMGKQIMHCNEKFYAYAPAMGSALLIAASGIHPNFRLNYRFNNKLFKQIKALKKLNGVPTSQAPYVSRRTPDFIQFLVWGVRSQVDQILINRILRKKNPKKRYRLFESLNWVEVYQQKTVSHRLKSYFKNPYVPEAVIKANFNLVNSRRSLEEWPLSNTDVMSISTLNLEIECLKNSLKP